jgi:DNA-binding CsgD family transcriptional regulator
VRCSRESSSWIHRLFAGSAFVNELLRPNDFGPVCGSPLHVGPEGAFVELTFYRAAESQPFAAEDLDFLKGIVPHFGRAARLRLRLERQARPPAWTLELLHALPWGVVLLAATQRPIFVNREAERIIAQADGLRLDRRGLCAEHPEDGRRLHRVMAGAVAELRDGACPGADVQLRRPSGARPLLLIVVPIGRRVLDGIGAGSPRVVVHIFDPARRPVTTAERLRAFFGLTPAEAVLAQALAAGQSLQEYAEQAHITCETARWRLKQILAKTDTHRQAELVRLLLASAVVR